MGLLHRIAALVAVSCVGLFWSTTVVVELFGSGTHVAAVKQAIVYGLVPLVLALAGLGISGARLARGRSSPLVAAKQRRMPWMAANGILVLIPAALYLNQLAAAGTFDARFYAVQLAELVAGAVNLRLMLANVSLGRRLVRGEAGARFE